MSDIRKVLCVGGPNDGETFDIMATLREFRVYIIKDDFDYSPYDAPGHPIPDIGRYEIDERTDIAYYRGLE